MSCKKLSLLCVVALAGCDGGFFDDSGPNVPNQPGPELRSGRLLDSPVINIDYRTETRAGVTNEQGLFSYLEGERVFFSIGALNLPSAPGAATITPMDMVGVQKPSDFRVVNILRLLQSLDEDGDPDNGVTITETAKNSATPVDFGLLEDDFESSGPVINLIVNAGQFPVVTSLVDTADAIDHFERVLLANGIPFGTVAEQNEKTITNYLEDNNLQAVRHESGMYYHIVEPGSGGSPSLTSAVVVRYRGFLPDGATFDETTGNNTATFNLAGLIEGWRIGIPLLQTGGSAILYIPSALGYGPAGTNGIPPNSVIIFEIELVSFT